MKIKRLLLITLAAFILISAAGCKSSGSETTTTTAPQKTEAPTTTTGAPTTPPAATEAVSAAGAYEGEWAMSPMMKPLVSLVLTEDGKYEFFVSIMGLVEEGTYTAEGKVITFTSSAAGAASVEGAIEDGIISAPFALGMGNVDLTFTQVGTPDDVYKNFLGDYLTTVMGRMEVYLELRSGRRYINYLSGEQGTFKIADGVFTLTPDEGTAVTGEFDLKTSEIKITMSVMPGTPSSEFTFTKVTEGEDLTYKGTSTVGMSGSTEVTLVLKKGNRFEVITTKPRGVGKYEIVEEGGKNVIKLTYLDPAARPDGTEFIMSGTTDNTDLSAAGNKIAVENVEYIVVMEGNPSVMNLQTVTFELQAD